MVPKIYLKCIKHDIQLSQMSKMSFTRSRTKYITLKLVSLDSMPSNWVKRYNFLLLSQNVLSEAHFVEHTEQNEQLHGQNLKILLGNRAYWIQHSPIRLKSLVPKLFSKLPLTTVSSHNFGNFHQSITSDGQIGCYLKYISKMYDTLHCGSSITPDDETGCYLKSDPSIMMHCIVLQVWYFN